MPMKPVKRKRQTKPKETTPKRIKSTETKPREPKATKLTATAEPERKLLVAVDFGTTFSALAFAQTRKVCLCSLNLTSSLMKWK